MTQPDQGYDIPVGLNTEGVVSGAQQGQEAVEGLQAAFAGLTVGAAAASRGLDTVSARAGRNIFGSASLTAAANLQGQLSGIAATAAVTRQSLTGLRSTVEDLARSMPGGTTQAIATVTSVQALGLAARNQQPQIRALSTEFTRLGAAVGEAAPQIATDFGQLNRELANLDPARVGRFADSLTTLHAVTGASAGSIIGFSQAIGPVAQAAGLGESSILGISAAFTKLGDDGGAAATAVNKILTDLNTSVREGSNQMTAYANATGMTVKQFRALFEANPAAALTQVTQSLAHAGPQAPFLLQTLGLDPTRTQRALLELSQSGGLAQTIQTSIGGYGSGATQKAAAAAFDNLDAKMQQLSSTATQLGTDALTPLLSPLEKVTGIFQGLLKPVAAIAGSRLGHDVLQLGGFGALGLLAGGKIGALGFGAARRLGGIAVGESLLTSGPVAALVASRRVARYGEAAEFDESRRGFGGYFARRYNPMIRAGLGMTDELGNPLPFGGRVMGGTNERAYNIGLGMFGSGGTSAQDRAALGEATSGMSGFGRVRQAAGMGLGLGFRGYWKLAAAPMQMAMTPSNEREWTFTSPGSPARQFAGAMKDLVTPGSGKGLPDASAALKDFTHATGGARGAMSGAMGALGTFAKASGGYGMQLGRAGLGTVGSLLGGIGLPSLALGAGALGYSLWQSSKSQAASNASDPSQMFAVVNEYRDSLGEAGVAAVNLSQQLTDAANSIASTVTTFKQARQVSPAELQAWGLPDPKKVPKNQRYTGTAAQAAAQINANYAGTPMTPQDMTAIAHSLHNQGYTPQKIEDILSKVDTTGSFGPSQINALVTHAGHLTGGHYESWGEWLKRASSLGQDQLTGQWDTIGRTGGGGAMIGSAGKNVIASITQGIQQRASQNAKTGGPTYAVGQALGQAQQAMQQALATHNANLVVALEQNLTRSLFGKQVGNTTAANIQRSGGFLEWLKAHHGDLRYGGKTIAQWEAEGALTAAATTVTPTEVSALKGKQQTVFGQFYTGGPGALQQRVAKAISTEVENPGYISKTAIAVVSALTANGTALNTIIGTAAKSLNTTDAGQRQLQQAILERAQFQSSVQQIGMNQGGQLRTQAQQSLALLSANGPNSQAEFQQGQQMGAQVLQQTTSYYQQRIMAQYQFNIQSERAQEDFSRQMGRAEQDYQIQSLRNWQDYHRQLSRSIQDAESQYYNPYQRIAAQPVFSATELLGNMNVQNQAEVQQEQNLKTARRMGLSAAAVNVLGLQQTQNAQQLQQLINDFASDPNIIRQVNASITRRGKATKSLYTDQGNVSYQRAKQDFDIANTRLEEDFKRQQDRAKTDFDIQMQRMNQDLQTQDLAITGNMKQLHKDMIAILNGDTVDWSHSLVNTMKQTLTDISPYIPKIKHKLASANIGGGGGDVGGGGSLNLTGAYTAHGGAIGNAEISKGRYVKPGTGAAVGGDPGSTRNANGTYRSRPTAEFVAAHSVDANFNQSIAKRMAPAWAKGTQWTDWVKLWNQESGWSQYAQNSTSDAYGIPQAIDPEKDYPSIGKDWRTNPATQIAWGIKYIRERYGSPANAWAHEQKFNWYGAGGIATGPQLGVLGEKGSPELMVPLNSDGTKWLLKAMKQYIGADQARSITSGGQAMAVTINSQTYHYDSRQQILGPVHVESTDPDRLGAALEKKARRDNLTASKGGPRRGN